jgi:hypothetical protein
VSDSIIRISTEGSSNDIKSLVVAFIHLQLTLGHIVMCCQDHEGVLNDLPNGTILTQEIIASLIFSVIEILTIEHHKLDSTFFHITFGSQSLLKPTSDQTGSDIN